MAVVSFVEKRKSLLGGSSAKLLSPDLQPNSRKATLCRVVSSSRSIATKDAYKGLQGAGERRLIVQGDDHLFDGLQCHLHLKTRLQGFLASLTVGIAISCIRDC
ncbi:hypothetical protein L596_010657 [Steinernema carpocapsae]|uniref:Uncharacterized protein n=1 Tax=Steinernema carpocapsae TaxID=34508 RepID=A0A4U5PJH9_STECR|nr:hypothetical protein L596_010657 [Steinernema carpocapsae]